MNYILTDIYVYPIKSLGGIRLEKSYVEKRGLQFDRRMMLIDNKNVFMTQRNHPKMALLKTMIIDNKIIVYNSINNQSIEINIDELKQIEKSNNSEKIDVIIWEDKIKALKVSKVIDEFFSETLKTSCSLVYMPDDSERIVDPHKKYVSDRHLVSFADAYPFLIIGNASLNDLNEKLKEKVPMNRFRPNLVFRGGNAFDEDKWKIFKISDITFYVVKPCARCIITTINQDTAEKSDEPLKTLSSYRKVNNKVLFGQNLVHNGIGEISINTELKILEWK
ncbi:MAG: MOSC domain-containing protein [Melioribacter sp.]|nr:MOSC domain-containing protein [Melioribacter sp.]